MNTIPEGIATLPGGRKHSSEQQTQYGSVTIIGEHALQLSITMTQCYTGKYHTFVAICIVTSVQTRDILSGSYSFVPW